MTAEPFHRVKRILKTLESSVQQPWTTQKSHLFLFAAFSAGIILMAMNWVGYDGADDLSYAQSAEAWLRHFPSLGTNHWALRYTVVLPVAASLLLLGQHEFSLCLPNGIFFLGLIYINHHFASRVLNPKMGGILALLVALTPAFIVQATYINLDLVETFFVSLSFWLFVSSAVDTDRPWLALSAGLAAGLAILTRETSCVLLVVFAIQFLFSSSAARKNYIWLGLGFVLVICAEFAFFGIMSGDILYRFRLDAHHDTVNRALIVSQTQASGNVLDREGGLSISAAIDPLLALFASQKFGLLFYLSIPFGIWLNGLVGLSSTERLTIRLAALLAILWIAFISSASFILYLVPRYYFVAAWASLVIIAHGCQKLLDRGRSKTVSLLIAALLIVNALSLYVENENPRFAERALVGYLRAHPGEIVHTDPDTNRRVTLLASFSGVTDRITATPVHVGDFFFYSPRNFELCAGALPSCSAFNPLPGWKIVDQFQERPRAIGGMLRALHLESLIPRQIRDKIERPSPTVAIYLVSSV